MDEPELNLVRQIGFLTVFSAPNLWEAWMRLSNAAIETLFRDEHKSLRRVTRRKMNHQDSEDIAQEAFLRLLEMERCETIADPRNYLFRTGLNIAIDWLRKARTRAAFLVEADGVDECSTINMTSDTPFDDWLTLHAVLTELSRLSDRCRDIFLLSRVYQLDNAEIAAKLGISIRTVNRDIGLATKHLHSVLDGPATQKKNSNLSPILQQKFVFVLEPVGNGDRNIERRNRFGALRYAGSQRRDDQVWIPSNCLGRRERAADAL